MPEPCAWGEHGSEWKRVLCRYQSLTNIDISRVVVDQMIEKYKDKSALTYQQMNVCSLEFPDESFDAVYSMNSLLHVPKRTLPTLLRNVGRLLRPGGLFFFGAYGGSDFEGEWDADPSGHRRFFSYHSDDALRGAVCLAPGVSSSDGRFEELHFGTVEATGRDPQLHFQALHLRKPT